MLTVQRHPRLTPSASPPQHNVFSLASPINPPQLLCSPLKGTHLIFVSTLLYSTQSFKIFQDFILLHLCIYIFFYYMAYWFACHYFQPLCLSIYLPGCCQIARPPSSRSPPLLSFPVLLPTACQLACVRDGPVIK